MGGNYLTSQGFQFQENLQVKFSLKIVVLNHLRMMILLAHFLSLPFSILAASCIAKITSCILGLEAPCGSTHCMAISATLHIDSVFTFPTRKLSIMLIISPFRINDLAYKNASDLLVQFSSKICNKT